MYLSVQAWNGSATRVCSSFDTASCSCPCSAVSACNPRKAIRRDAPSSASKPMPVQWEERCHLAVGIIGMNDRKMGFTCSRCRLILERGCKTSLGDCSCLHKDTDETRVTSNGRERWRLTNPNEREYFIVFCDALHT